VWHEGNDIGGAYVNFARFAAVLVVLMGVVSEAQDAVSLAAIPLGSYPSGLNKGVDKATLERAFQDALATEANVALAPRKEVDATLKALACSARKESSGKWIARFAFASGRLYALSAFVGMTPSGQLRAEGDVARDDGEMVASGVARAAWISGKEPYEQVKGVLLRLLGVLQIDRLPVFRGVPIGACVFDSKLRDRAQERLYVLNRAPFNEKPVFERASEEVREGLRVGDCVRTIAGLERMERAAALSVSEKSAAEALTSASSADGERFMTGIEMIGDQYREYVREKQEAWGARLSAQERSGPVVRKANENIENGLAAGDCHQVRSGLAQLGRAAGIQGIEEE